MTNEELGKLFKDSVSAGVKDALKAVGVTSTKTRSKKTDTKVETSDDFVREQNKIIDEYKKEEKFIEATNKTRTKGVDIQKQKIEALNKEASALKQLIRVEIAAGKNVDALSKQLEQLNLELDVQTNRLGKLEKQSVSLFKKIGKAAEVANKALNFVGADALNLQGLTNYVKKIDTIGASFAKGTGAGRRYIREMRDEQERFGSTFGVTLEDTSRGYKDLSMNLINFNNISEDSRKQIFGQSIVFDQLGQSYQETAKNVNELSTTLGMTSDQSFQLQKDLGQVAIALGMSVSDINSSFISNLNRLSIYGSGAKDQFLRIQTFAKATNIEMGTLTDLTDKLSTFEGSGEFAGRLNAIAGMDLFDVGTLTTLEGEDKLRYISDRIQAAGFNLDDPKMMRVIKDATGLDADSFRKLAGVSVGKIADMNASMAKETAKGPSELAKRATEAATQAEKVAGAIEGAQSREEAFTNAFDKYTKLTNMQISAYDKMSGDMATLTGAMTMLTAALASMQGGGGFGDMLKDTGGMLKETKDLVNAGKLSGASRGSLAKMAGKSMLKNIKVPVVGGLIAGGMNAFDTYGKTGSIGKAATMGATTGIGAGLGGYGGAAAGAALGTLIFPGVGTAAGALIGGLLGGYGGEKAGQALGSVFTDVEDSAAIPGRPLIKTAAGQLLRAKESDAVFTVDMNAAKSGTKQSDDSLTTAVKQLVQAITTSSKEIVLTIDGKTLQRVAFQEFTPRYAG
jgi:hypothetical protein